MFEKSNIAYGSALQGMQAAEMQGAKVQNLPVAGITTDLLRLSGEIHEACRGIETVADTFWGTRPEKRFEESPCGSSILDALRSLQDAVAHLRANVKRLTHGNE